MVAYKYVTQQKIQWNVCMVYNGFKFYNLLGLVFWWKTGFGIHRLSVVYRLYVVVIIWMLLAVGHASVAAMPGREVGVVERINKSGCLNLSSLPKNWGGYRMVAVSGGSIV